MRASGRTRGRVGDRGVGKHRVARRDLTRRAAGAGREERAIPRVAAAPEQVAGVPTELAGVAAQPAQAEGAADQLPPRVSIGRARVGEPLPQAVVGPVEVVQLLERWQPDVGMLPEVRPEPRGARLLGADAEKVHGPVVSARAEGLEVGGVALLDPDPAAHLAVPDAEIVVALGDDQVALGLFLAAPIGSSFAPLNRRTRCPSSSLPPSVFALPNRAVRGVEGRPAAARIDLALHSLAQLGVALEELPHLVPGEGVLHDTAGSSSGAAGSSCDAAGLGATKQSIMPNTPTVNAFIIG